MSCTYMFYKEEDRYFPRLYCSIDNKQCIFSKRCNKEERFVPNGNLWEDCGKMIEANMKNIPKGSYFIKATTVNRRKKLFLYVAINNRVEKIATDFETINQDYIYLKEGIDGYEVSLVPFPEERTTPQEVTEEKTETKTSARKTFGKNAKARN